MIYFEGGGLCRGDGLADMIEYCYQRSFTHLGSSNNYSDSRSFDKWSYLSSDIEANPSLIGQEYSFLTVMAVSIKVQDNFQFNINKEIFTSEDQTTL